MFIYNVKINGSIILKIIIITLSIFMLIVFGISVYRIFFTSGKISVKDMVKTNEISEIQPDNYTNILQAVHNDIDSYKGMKIKFTGYVYKLIDFDNEQFVLARDMLINEQGTQSVIVGFLSEYKDIQNFKNGDWIEIIGIIEKGKYHNKEIPVIKVLEAKSVIEPESPFVISPNSAYIPTSGLL